MQSLIDKNREERMWKDAENLAVESQKEGLKTVSNLHLKMVKRE